eukprot:6049553-Prymnesium_polylepis.1
MDVCVCVLRIYGSTERRDVVRGRDTRRGRAADTAGPHTAEYTHIRRPAPALCVFLVAPKKRGHGRCRHRSRSALQAATAAR